MNSTEISMPITKAASAITVAAAAQADVADKAAQELTKNATFETWMAVNSIPFFFNDTATTEIYTSLLSTEWFWKKLWRPAFERWGWIKPRLGPRIITLDEYRQMTETQRADLS